MLARFLILARIQIFVGGLTLCITFLRCWSVRPCAPTNLTTTPKNLIRTYAPGFLLEVGLLSIPWVGGWGCSRADLVAASRLGDFSPSPMPYALVDGVFYVLDKYYPDHDPKRMNNQTSGSRHCRPARSFICGSLHVSVTMISGIDQACAPQALTPLF